MSDFPLESRDGLPDALAWLRPSYPRDGWRAHSNFGELSNFWFQVHDHLREHGAALDKATSDFREGRLDAGRYRQFFVPNLNRFLGHLNGHHQIEDQHYFPKFRALDQRMVAGFELLEQDHQHIHEALLASAESANRFLQSFAAGDDAVRRAADAYATMSERLLAMLRRHLADEEDLVMPAMLHFGERQVS